MNRKTFVHFLCAVAAAGTSTVQAAPPPPSPPPAAPKSEPAPISLFERIARFFSGRF